MAASGKINKSTWQKRCDRDFPILCIKCGNDVMYDLAVKDRDESECQTCFRSFNIQRWFPRFKIRFRRTKICRTCSELYNLCQSCLLLLDFLFVDEDDPDFVMSSELNDDQYLENVEREFPGLDLSWIKCELKQPLNFIRLLVQTSLKFRKSILHICSLWVIGKCTRGKICPYYHLQSTDVRTAAFPPSEDRSTIILYIGNLGSLTQQDIRDYFCQYGEIRYMSLVPSHQCALVQYTTKDATLTAVEKNLNYLFLRNQRLSIKIIAMPDHRGHTYNLNPYVEPLPRLQELLSLIFALDARYTAMSNMSYLFSFKALPIIGPPSQLPADTGSTRSNNPSQDSSTFEATQPYRDRQD